MRVAFGVFLKSNERKLIEALESGVPSVDFVFRKADGERRNARGTRNLKNVPPQHWPKGWLEKEIKTDVDYFDLQKQQWRAFRLGSIISPA